MWHEARRREKATQKLLIDHRKRAEKRREEDRIDPNSLLQVHGFKSKLYPDLNAHKQATKSLVSWQGDSNVTIDRFDVRATLSSIPSDDTGDKRDSKHKDKLDLRSKRESVLDIGETEYMKKLLTFERYRLLMQNDLNKVPEENRLKLVSKSECFTDVRLRKLQRNKFGTSGETSKPTTSTSKTCHIASSIGNKNAQNNRLNQQAIRQRVGVSIGFNYSQSSQKGQNPTEDVRLDEGAQSTRNVIDLDDYDEIDLDDISASSKHGSKRTQEVISKYGLANKEFDLLQSQEERNLKQSDLLKELKRLKDKNMHDSSRKDTTMPAEVYGPALPPEMLSKLSQDSHCSSRSSSPQSPVVGQRSPSGADIPMRNGQENNHDDDDDDDGCEECSDNRTDATQPIDVEPQVSTIDPKPIHLSYICRSSVSGDLKANGCASEKQANVSPKPSGSQMVSKVDDKDVDHGISQTEKRRPRRAATPLAYKRHRRSSRSLSRERRTSSHHSSRHRDKRKQQRSHSGSSVSTSSHSDTSESSYSDSSASDSYTSESSYSSRSPRDNRSRRRSRFRSTGRGTKSKSSHQNHRSRARR